MALILFLVCKLTYSADPACDQPYLAGIVSKVQDINSNNADAFYKSVCQNSTCLSDPSSQLYTLCAAATTAKKAKEAEEKLWKMWAGAVGICGTACALSMAPFLEAAAEAATHACNLFSLSVSITDAALTHNIEGIAMTFIGTIMGYVGYKSVLFGKKDTAAAVQTAEDLDLKEAEKKASKSLSERAQRAMPACLTAVTSGVSLGLSIQGAKQDVSTYLSTVKSVLSYVKSNAATLGGAFGASGGDKVGKLDIKNFSDNPNNLTRTTNPAPPIDYNDHLNDQTGLDKYAATFDPNSRLVKGTQSEDFKNAFQKVSQGMSWNNAMKNMQTPEQGLDMGLAALKPELKAAVKDMVQDAMKIGENYYSSAGYVGSAQKRGQKNATTDDFQKMLQATLAQFSQKKTTDTVTIEDKKINFSQSSNLIQENLENNPNVSIFSRVSDAYHHLH